MPAVARRALATMWARPNKMGDSSVGASGLDKMHQTSRKLKGRAFYESIGSPKMIVAPMVDRSDFAWRMLTRSFLDHEQQQTLLAYSPMLHSRLFRETAKYRDAHFQPTKDSLTSYKISSSPPWLDGHPKIDRPLFVQFCSNDPEDLLDAAQYVAPYCDAVDLNLGCPQGIARSGHYGAFLQEDWDLIHKLISKLDEELPVPVTAKMRILESKERTLAYAKMILAAGASIITVHGRRREQKGHNMGIADWSYIRFLRENLPPETVIFANGNILNQEDLQPCLEATGADAVMSAEGNLSDPSIFGISPLPGTQVHEYWRDENGKGGYRVDAVVRRYLDIIHHYVLESEPPKRRPLFLPGDPPEVTEEHNHGQPDGTDAGLLRGKRKRERQARNASPSLKAMQGHLFQLLRPLITTHTEIRDALSKCRVGDIQGFERVLTMTENAVRQALIEGTQRLDMDQPSVEVQECKARAVASVHNHDVVSKYKRPWWICQPYIRPLPEEAIKTGALTTSRKRLAKPEKHAGEDEIVEQCGMEGSDRKGTSLPQHELLKEAIVCG